MLVLPASEKHLADLARFRVALLEETGQPLSPALRREMLESNEAFFRNNLNSPAWASWVAEFSGQVGAVGTLAFWERPPYPGNPEGKDAYFLNMYTAPEFRKSGAAAAILDAALAHARACGVRKVVLHATEAGRPMYLKAGFVPSAAYLELALDGRAAA